MGKKILLTIYKERRSSKKAGFQDFERCSKNKEHANKKHNTLGLCHTNDLKPCDKDMDWLLVSLVLSLYLCTVGLQSIEVL